MALLLNVKVFRCLFLTHFSFLDDLQEEKKVGGIKFSKTSENHHHGIILCVAISPDNQYLVTGGVDKKIKVWKFDTLQFVQDLGNHRGAVTSLIFRQSGALELYSGSTDRSIKVSF